MPVKLLADYKGKRYSNTLGNKPYEMVSSPENGKDNLSQGRIWKIYVKYTPFNTAVKG